MQVSANISLQYLHECLDAYTSHIMESLCPCQDLNHMHALDIHPHTHDLHCTAHVMCMHFLLPDSCHLFMLQSCRHGPSTIYLTGVHANPVLEPTSIVFQQAADVGMSHCTLLRHVLSRACVRAGLPPIPPPIVQDVTDTNLVCQNSLTGHYCVTMLSPILALHPTRHLQSNTSPDTVLLLIFRCWQQSCALLMSGLPNMPSNHWQSQASSLNTQTCIFAARTCEETGVVPG